ncbi:MAG: NfeD family protein [Clostridia bacterium]|nr:NfeD family protein [Clostridia bacterium]
MIDSICWVVAIIVFAAVEAGTAMLVSIWFAGGSLAALIASLLGSGVYVQVLVFLVVSALCLFALRKAAFKNMKTGNGKTNLDRIIGQEIIITETVDNINRQGAADINDVKWKVKSETGEVISAGETATVTDIEGVKLVVRR